MRGVAPPSRRVAFLQGPYRADYLLAVGREVDEEKFLSFDSDKFYVYLVDEVTSLPVEGDNYPIEITKTSKMAKKLLPFMTVGLRALCVAGDLFNLFYPKTPLPDLPAGVCSGLEEFVRLMKKKSGIDEFDMLQSSLDEDYKEGMMKAGGEKGNKKQARGAALREFRNLLVKHDPEGLYAGLSRKLELGNDRRGVVWTVQEEGYEPYEPKDASKKPDSPGGPKTGWLIKFPRRDELLAPLSRKRRRFFVLSRNSDDWNIEYYKEEKHYVKGSKPHGTIKGLKGLKDLKVEDGRLSFAIGGRLWEFEGEEIGEWKEALD